MKFEDIKIGQHLTKRNKMSKEQNIRNVNNSIIKDMEVIKNELVKHF